MVALGVDVTFIKDPFTGSIRFLGVLAVPLTILWIVCFENVINLSDGLDGLAAGISGITALVTVFASAKQEDQRFRSRCRVSRQRKFGLGLCLTIFILPQFLWRRRGNVSRAGLWGNLSAGIGKVYSRLGSFGAYPRAFGAHI